MRTNIDFSPFYRSSIGFDRLFGLLENASRLQAIDSWPPYDIAKTGEDAYRITMAVAGFSQDMLEVTQQQNLLVVSGKSDDDGNAAYLHRGIAGRSFSRQFELADHVHVVGAHLENGILTIDLQRQVPEEMKPRRIAVVTGQAGHAAAPQQIEQKAA